MNGLEKVLLMVALTAFAIGILVGANLGQSMARRDEMLRDARTTQQLAKAYVLLKGCRQ